MRSLSFLQLAWRRLKSRALLSLLVVWSVAVTIAVIVAVPVFAEGVSRQILQQELASRTQQLDRPPFSVRFYSLPKTREPLSVEDVRYASLWIRDLLREEVGLPVLSRYSQLQSTQFQIRLPGQEDISQMHVMPTVRVTCVEGLAEQVRTVEGEAFGTIASEGELDVWLMPGLAEELGAQVGDLYEMAHFFRRGTVPLQVRVAGIIEPLDASGRFWYWSPRELFRDSLITTEAEYEAHIAPLMPEGVGFAFWYFILDDSVMSLDRVPGYSHGLEMVRRAVAERLPDGTMDYAPTRELADAQQRKETLTAVLLSFALSLMAMLMFFVGSVSLVTARTQVRETAILASRGSSRRQLLALQALEALLLVATAVPLGAWLGLGIARALGFSQGFLTFGPRPPLETYLSAADWRLVMLGSGVALLARLAPTWVASRQSIVRHEQQSARREAVWSAARGVALLALVGVTCYAYYRLHAGGPVGLLGHASRGDLWSDPLVLLAPTLFLFASSLLATELFLLAMRPLRYVARLLPSAAAYYGATSLATEGRQYRVPLFLLILCLNLGVFYASLARSADAWLVDRLRYYVGADLSFQHDSAGGGDALYEAWVLPVSAYEEIPGVERATRVGEYLARVRSSGVGVGDLQLLAIDRLDFPSVAYWRSDYGPAPLGELMNRLGSREAGALLMAGLDQALMVEVGDTLQMEVLIHDLWQPIEFVYLGSFAHFPTVYENERPAVVVNMDYLQREIGGAFAHGVWMRLAPEADGKAILRSIQSRQVEPAQARDLRELLAADQARLERVGVFGLLTVCFLLGTLLACAELVLYSVTTLTSRSQRFAVLRAIGMLPKELVTIVAVEYAAIVAFGVLAGAALGVVSSRLYVPYFRVIDIGAVPVPPFVPVIDLHSAAWMAVVLACLLILTEVAVLVRMVRAHLFEALRLGSQE